MSGVPVPFLPVREATLPVWVGGGPGPQQSRTVQMFSTQSVRIETAKVRNGAVSITATGDVLPIGVSRFCHSSMSPSDKTCPSANSPNSDNGYST